VRLDIAWRVTERVSRDYPLRLLLVDASGRSVQDKTLPLTAVSYPLPSWPVGSIVRGQYDLVIPADAPALLRLDVGLDGAGTMQALARLTVAPVVRITTPPDMEHLQTATFGAVATLLGYDIAPQTARPGQTVNVTLYWQAGSAAGAGRSYTVFTHLLGTDHLIYGQHDGQPADGTRPTTGWVEGEIIVDRHRLVVKAETLPGEYALEIGLYEPVSEHRLDVLADGGQRSDYLILTTSVRVEK
jgi:hypothetical protein